MANYQAPEGVTVYKEHLEGRSITHSAVDDRIINKGQGVVIKSSTNRVTLTKTYSRSSDNYSDNSLIGTDYKITNPGCAYGLGYKESAGVAFYKLKSTGTIRANKAYLIIEDIYLTQWKIVGNSEVHGQEIWSCGEYSEVDNKWHIRILPEGYGVVDIALDEPLRKVNNVADDIEFADGVATLIRNLGSVDMFTLPWALPDNGIFRSMTNTYVDSMKFQTLNLLNIRYKAATSIGAVNLRIGVTNSQAIPILRVKDTNYTDVDTFKDSLQGVELIYELATSTIETIQVPQIEEAESYSCVISQGGKAVSWSSFETE